MKRYFYDFEFLEDGRTIDPISLGIVCDDGREYYAVFRDAPWKRVKKHAWLMANVVPHLPKAYGEARNHMPKSWLFNYDDSAVKPKAQIAGEVVRFLRGPNEPIELWGYFAAYDHVALAQLWGPMINRPPGIPMWTNDVQQLAEMWELEGFMPEQPPNAHNALADARWTMKAYDELHRVRNIDGVSSD